MQAINYTHEGLVLFLRELKIKLNKPAMNLLAWLMVALLEKTKAHLFTLADKPYQPRASFPDDETTDAARQQKVRRFLSNPTICPVMFVDAIVAMIRPLFEDAPVLELIIDRTEWIKRQVPVNVLNVAINYKGRAIPLFWCSTNRRGVSGLVDWQNALTPVIYAFRSSSWAQNKPLHVLGDREFASPKLSQWLWETFRVDSTLRLKKSEYLQTDDAYEPIRDYFERLARGQCRFFRQCTVTQSSEFVMNVALWWGKGYDEPWALMTTHRNLPVTVTTYGKRYGIEPMHKDWKTNAFDIESTRVTDAKRIDNLLIPIALCYVLCVLEGDRKEVEGSCVKAHKEKRTKGLFLVGLCAFCRILRTNQLSRIRQFFDRLFTGWLWPEKLVSSFKT